MHLTLGQQRVEELAGVVDGDELAEPHVTGLGVDLHHGDVGAERERRHLGHVVGVGRERSLLPGDEVGPGDGAGRRAGDVEATGAVVEHDVVDRRLEEVGRPLARRLDEQVGGLGHGRATDLHRARARR